MKRGEIWLAELPGRIGRQQQGRRPVVVLADSDVGLVAVVPLTSQIHSQRFEHTVRIKCSKANGLASDSVAMAFQIASIDARLLVHRIGELEQKHVTLIDRALRSFLGL